MNVLERAECLLDAGSSGNMNFTVIVSYRGCLESPVLQNALAALQAQHQLLRSTLQWQGDHCRFVPTAAAVPITVLPWPGDGDPRCGQQLVATQAWKPATKVALRQRFEGGGEPLWRLSWLRGAQAGELLLTFHHAIADGLSSMALVQRLFSLLAAGAAGAVPAPQPEWDAFTPDLARTFAEPAAVNLPVDPLPDRQDLGLSTSYGLEQISAASSGALLAWTRQRGLRLNATLHAAFLQALVAADALPAQTTATTVVNLRQLARPVVPWELMRLLRVCVDTPVLVDPEAPLEWLAAQLHGALQQQLAAQLAPGGLITNLGRVPVMDEHGPFRLERLFFVANVEPIALPDRPLAVLGALSFNGQLSLTSFQIEQQLSDQRAAAVMADMKQRLLALV